MIRRVITNDNDHISAVGCRYRQALPVSAISSWKSTSETKTSGLTWVRTQLPSYDFKLDNTGMISDVELLLCGLTSACALSFLTNQPGLSLR